MWVFFKHFFLEELNKLYFLTELIHFFCCRPFPPHATILRVSLLWTMFSPSPLQTTGFGFETTRYSSAILF